MILITLSLNAMPFPTLHISIPQLFPLPALLVLKNSAADLRSCFFLKSTEPFATFRLHMASILGSSSHWEASDYHNINEK